VPSKDFIVLIVLFFFPFRPSPIAIPSTKNAGTSPESPGAIKRRLKGLATRTCAKRFSNIGLRQMGYTVGVFTGWR